MLFDKFDKKIKEAAEQHHPAYDENAWRKMENLLNQHLPRGKNRRRFFLLAFTVLLVGGGAFILLSNPHAENSDQIVPQAKNSTSSKTQANKTDNTIIVQPSIDNANKGITVDNTVAGTATNIADKTGNGPVVVNQKNVLPPQSKQKVDKNELLLNNSIVDRDKTVAGNETEKKNDVVQHAPVPLQPDA